MDVLLSKELEHFISEQVKIGNYLSKDELIGQAVFLLKEKEQVKEIQRELLRKELKPAIDQLRRGEGKAYSDPSALAQEIISRGELCLAQEQKQKNG